MATCVSSSEHSHKGIGYRLVSTTFLSLLDKIRDLKTTQDAYSTIKMCTHSTEEIKRLDK